MSVGQVFVVGGSRGECLACEYVHHVSFEEWVSVSVTIALRFKATFECGDSVLRLSGY